MSGNAGMERSQTPAVKPIAKSSASAQSMISKSVAGSAAAFFGSRLRGVILVGSFARDEATEVWGNGSRQVLGDAELLLVFADEVWLPPVSAIASFKQEAETELAQQGVLVKLDFAAVPPNYLRRMQPSIYAYEVKTWARVIWGDCEVLSLIPAFSVSDIPLEDAWRLLCNRIVELLEKTGEMDLSSGELSPAAHYRTVKLYQDMATSYLVFAGCYEPSYRSRAERLTQMASSPQPAPDIPFPLAEFSARVTACTRFKLTGDSSSASIETLCPASAGFMRAAIGDAHALWQWELAHLIQDRGHLPDAELMRKWMRTLSFRKRMRGWAYVLRQCGWYGSFGLWPRWLRLVVKSSPRYCVYAAASQLFFRLPEIAKSSPAPLSLDGGLRQIRSWLPVAHRPSDLTASGWRQVALDICRNYERFLKDTRS